MLFSNFCKLEMPYINLLGIIENSKIRFGYLASGEMKIISKGLCSEENVQRRVYSSESIQKVGMVEQDLLFPDNVPDLGVLDNIYEHHNKKFQRNIRVGIQFCLVILQSPYINMDDSTIATRIPGFPYAGSVSTLCFFRNAVIHLVTCIKSPKIPAKHAPI